MSSNKRKVTKVWHLGEVLLAYLHVEKLINLGVAETSIAVITPYNLQVPFRTMYVSRIFVYCALLTGAFFAVVHQFQVRASCGTIRGRLSGPGEGGGRAVDGSVEPDRCRSHKIAAKVPGYVELFRASRVPGRQAANQRGRDQGTATRGAHLRLGLRGPPGRVSLLAGRPLPPVRSGQVGRGVSRFRTHCLLHADSYYSPTCVRIYLNLKVITSNRVFLDDMRQVPFDADLSTFDVEDMETKKAKDSPTKQQNSDITKSSDKKLYSEPSTEKAKVYKQIRSVEASAEAISDHLESKLFLV